jgi:putative peptidoglycan lipid II flippase
MSLWTLISRVTGFVRTWAMAFALGVTAIADSYDIANNLPNMLFELLAGGVLSSVFIPLFMERMQRDGEDDAWRFASYVLNIIVIGLGALALVATVWPTPFVRSQTLTIPAEQATLAIWFFRFFAVQIIFYGMGLVFTGVLNSYRHFVAPAVAPIFNNLVVTATLLGFYVPFRESNPSLALTGLAVGTTLGVVVMAAVQLPTLARLGIRYTPRIDWRHPGLVAVGGKMVPILVYVVTNLFAVTVRTNVAVATAEGGQAALRYAWQFYQLPYGIFAVSLATAIFPELAERANARDMPAFRAMFARGMRGTIVLMLPLSALLVALATPVITLYRAGRFTAEDVPVVAGVLAWWAAGLLFFAVQQYLLKSFYSLQDALTPTYLNIGATALHVSLYVLLARGIGSWSGLGIIGIPIADGIYFLLFAAVMFAVLRRRVGTLEGRSLAATGLKAAAGSAAGAAIAHVAMLVTGGLAEFSGGFIIQLAIAGVLGLVAAYGVMAALGTPELAGFVERISSRVSRRSRP